jgi:antitoxin MazE
MNLQIAKWGNSLAPRIPSDIARRLDLHAGDSVEVRPTADGALSIRSKDWSRASFASEIDAARDGMPVGTSVLKELRGTGAAPGQNSHSRSAAVDWHSFDGGHDA